MNNPDFPRASLSQNLLLKVQSQARNILDAVERITIEDEVDRNRVVKAGAFIENPTENLSDIMGYTTSIGHVLSGYMMQGIDPPPEIDAMHGHLLALQFSNRINFIEEALAQGSSDSPEFKKAMALALDWAITLSKGYNDDTFLSAFNEFKDSHNL